MNLESVEKNRNAPDFYDMSPGNSEIPTIWDSSDIENQL